MIRLPTAGKQHAVLAADVTATSTTGIDSGLAISLAGDSVYEITGALVLSGDTDGMRFTIAYSGTADTSYVALLTPTNVGAQRVTVAAEYTQSSLVGWDIAGLLGVIRTSTSGILKITFRKNTDLGADTTISEGSWLAARLLQ